MVPARLDDVGVFVEDDCSAVGVRVLELEVFVEGVGVDMEDDMTGAMTSNPTRPDVIAVLGSKTRCLSLDDDFHPELLYGAAGALC